MGSGCSHRALTCEKHTCRIRKDGATGAHCSPSCCRKQLCLPWQGVKLLLPQWLPGEDVFSFTNTHKEIQNAFNLRCVPLTVLEDSGTLENSSISSINEPLVQGWQGVSELVWKCTGAGPPVSQPHRSRRPCLCVLLRIPFSSVSGEELKEVKSLTCSGRR